MRRTADALSIIYTVVLLGSAFQIVGVAGCAPSQSAHRDPIESIDAEPSVFPAEPAPGGHDLETAAQEQADRLAVALAEEEQDRIELPPVAWIERDLGGGETAKKHPTAGPEAQDASPDFDRDPAGVEHPPAVEEYALADTNSTQSLDHRVRSVVSVEGVAGSEVPVMDHRELFSRLRDQIRSQDGEPEVRRAMKEAILEVLDHPGRAGSLAFDGLNERETEMVRTYAALLTGLEETMIDDPSGERWEQTAKQIRALVEDSSLQIVGLKLCRSVHGFGVYDEINGSTFLAGRDHPLIIYVELDGFESSPRADGQYEVRLAKEVFLHNEADDLVVWHDPKLTVVDTSRKARKDFFLVRLVRLPARLSVGKYMLKVRVTDEANGNIGESVVPIQVVADRALAAGGGS